ncbi:MAG: nitrate ABC transporter permease, partial [Moorea sp. SIO3I7]|nr:nitrate ABC transporter permease [Moorena sp. SIO3I7]
MTSIPKNVTHKKQQLTIFENENFRALLLFIVSLGIFLLFWELGAKMKVFAKGMPTASLTIKELWYW